MNKHIEKYYRDQLRRDAPKTIVVTNFEVEEGELEGGQMITSSSIDQHTFNLLCMLNKST